MADSVPARGPAVEARDDHAPILSLVDVTRRYETVTILQDISLEVRNQEFVAIAWLAIHQLSTIDYRLLTIRQQ